MSDIHPEDALFKAGASDGYYEIVGAGYTPATGDSTETAAIDLSTVDHTGCLLTHDYGTGKTTLKWDTDFGEGLYGDAEDVRVVIEDITREPMRPRELFAAFREAVTAGERAR